MTTIEFRLQVEELGIGAAATVTPYIAGESLVELARRVEVGPATQHGEADLAGAYAGLVIDGHPWREWYAGRPQTWFGDGDSCLLGCSCGDTGCWPLTARVTMGASLVVWSDFRTGHRSWDLTALGPFRFDRHSYDYALEHPTRS